MITLLVHIANAEPIKIDVEEIPNPSDAAILGQNPRDRKENDLTWLEDGVATVMLPWWRINYIEIMPTEDEEDDVLKLYRDD